MTREPLSSAALDLWRPTPLNALERTPTTTELHFVRDHFPHRSRDPRSWVLQVDGATHSLAIDLERLSAMPSRTLNVVLECAGHRRIELDPVPEGVPWGIGAVSESRWTGTSLRQVVDIVGIPAHACEIVLEGADAGTVDGHAGIHRFARSLPLPKALERDVLLAYALDAKPIPAHRGGPVRAIVPGWYATDSVKWLDRVWFTDREFEGVFQAHDYRLLVPGEQGPGRRMTDLPVHALITSPADGEAVPADGAPRVRGVAWGGNGGVAAVLVRVDLAPWTPARLGELRGRYSLRGWELPCRLARGRHTIACRAIDRAGEVQPERPVPNIHGYANNSVHRIGIRAI